MLLKAKGKGVNLFMPQLPLAIPVTAQLVDHETGVCWEATYSAPSKNDGLNFKAKSD